VPDARGALTHSGIGTFSAAISGPGGFIKSGLGALFIAGISGGNSYTGPTLIKDGLVEAVRRPGRSLSSDITVSGPNAVLRTGRASGNQFISAITVLPTGANVTVQDGALWAMNPTNRETLNRLLGDGRVDLGSGSTLTFTNNVSFELAAIVSGTGAINKRRSLTSVHVTSDSPFSGPTAVFEGFWRMDGSWPNSPVTVKSAAELRGDGTVGNLMVEADGVVKPEPNTPGQLGADLQVSSANFLAGGILGLAFYGAHQTGGNDSLLVNGPVTLNNTRLSSGFQYPPREGDVIFLIRKTTPGAVSGTFSGFPQGALRSLGDIPVVMSYVGGDGNDVTLTVTNLPLHGGGAQLVSGNGGNALVPNDCSLLRLVVTNRGAVTLSNLRGTLRSLTAGLLVTMAESAFPNLPPNGRGTNLQAFQIRTEPFFPCGSGAELELVLTGSNLPPISVLYTLLGNAGHALGFNGSGNYVAVPHRSALNAFPLSVTTWVNASGGSDLVNKYVSSSLNGWNVFIRGGRVRAWYFVSGSRFIWDGGDGLDGGPVTDGLWHHVAFTVDSTGGKLYVDGVLKDSRAWTGVPGPATTTQEVHLGTDAANTIPFNALLDEITIWNTALSHTQIQTNMRRSLTGAEANLLAYYRCDESSGPNVADSAPLDGNNNGAWIGTPRFVLSGVAPFSVPDGVDCNSGGGACESCFVVMGQFTTNLPTTLRPPQFVGAPSVCFPPKPCPQTNSFADIAFPYVSYPFINSTTKELCITAQLRIDCPALLGVVAYLGTNDVHDPCVNYLGDAGFNGLGPFSFRVPAGSNFVINVVARTTNAICGTHTLEVFGLPCPPPTLAISRETAPNKVRIHWSTAYPDFRPQQASTVAGAFSNVSQSPVIVGGRYALTNITANSNRFYRLFKP
jgi:autotransporter-associated beta strand protein